MGYYFALYGIQQFISLANDFVQMNSLHKAQFAKLTTKMLYCITVHVLHTYHTAHVLHTYHIATNWKEVITCKCTRGTQPTLFQHGH